MAVSGKINRPKEIVLGILLLIPVVAILWFCAIVVKSDVILQSWISNILRVFVVAVISVVAYFLLQLMLFNLKAALRMIFRLRFEKKK